MEANLQDFRAILQGVEQGQSHDVCQARYLNAQRMAQAVCQGLP